MKTSNAAFFLISISLTACAGETVNAPKTDPTPLASCALDGGTHHELIRSGQHGFVSASGLKSVASDGKNIAVALRHAIDDDTYVVIASAGGELLSAQLLPVDGARESEAQSPVVTKHGFGITWSEAHSDSDDPEFAVDSYYAMGSLASRRRASLPMRRIRSA